MKLLIFSDIHGNSLTLNSLIELSTNQEFEKVIFLGDIFGYYYDQEKCFNLMGKIPNLIWLKGNHDEYAVKSYFGEIDEKKLIASYGHSYEDLRKRFSLEHMTFLKKLKSSKVIEIDEKKIGLFHGRPSDSLEGRIYNDTIIDEKELSDFDVVFLGHTHCKIDRCIGGKRVISPGSLGQPRDGKGYGYAIFDTDTDRCEFRNISVDNNYLKSCIDNNDLGLENLYDVLSRELKEEM